LRSRGLDKNLSSLLSTLSPQPSALSPQPSALCPQLSALSPRSAENLWTRTALPR